MLAVTTCTPRASRETWCCAKEALFVQSTMRAWGRWSDWMWDTNFSKSTGSLEASKESAAPSGSPVDSSIFVALAMPRTRRSEENLVWMFPRRWVRRSTRFFAMSFSSKMIPTDTVISLSRKAECMARRARSVWSLCTTMEILRSSQPWAIDTTLTCALPRASKTRPETPVALDIPSPTTATMEQGDTVEMALSWPWETSREKWSCSSFLTRSMSESLTAKQRECSDDAWQMSWTCTFACASTLKIRWVTPQTPIMPVPATLTSAMLSIVEKPATQLFRRTVSSEGTKIRVPDASGLKVFLMKMGIRALIAGSMVFGWITFAPKYASSMASLYETSGST
mmetsp:Transcript_31783/g.92314  ORF Transcript_31783/g.92314 Transcript_31783/m.92314 type:complete len:339 (-) Transcript_31783:774-1790(-)